MTNKTSYVISHQQIIKKHHTGGISLQYPHRSCTVILIDWIAPEVSLLKAWVNALIFLQYLLYQIVIAPCLFFHINLLYSFVFIFVLYSEADRSWRIRNVALHTPYVLYVHTIFYFQGTFIGIFPNFNKTLPIILGNNAPRLINPKST